MFEFAYNDTLQVHCLTCEAHECDELALAFMHSRTMTSQRVACHYEDGFVACKSTPSLFRCRLSRWLEEDSRRLNAAQKERVALTSPIATMKAVVENVSATVNVKLESQQG